MSESDGTASATGSTGLSEQDAAARIEALLAGTGDSEGDETKRKPAAASDSEEDEDDGLTAEDDAPEEEESDEQEETEEEAPEPRTYTVKVDGEDVQVTEDELLRGYSRTQDYTRKTMELAEARKAIEPERQALRAERETYAQLLPRLEAHLQQQWESPDLQELRHTNPAEYLIRRDELAQQTAAVQQERERLERVQQQEAFEARQEEVKREVQALLKSDPEFAKPGVYDEAKAYALSLGFSSDDLEDTLHHQAWIVLRKAMQFDRLKAKAPQTKAKVDAVKTARPGTTTRQLPKVAEVTRAKQRLAKTGRVEDAAAAIERMLG
jgi:hypothetical protein